MKAADADGTVRLSFDGVNGILRFEDSDGLFGFTANERGNHDPNSARDHIIYVEKDAGQTGRDARGTVKVATATEWAALDKTHAYVIATTDAVTGAVAMTGGTGGGESPHLDRDHLCRQDIRAEGQECQ